MNGPRSPLLEAGELEIEAGGLPLLESVSLSLEAGCALALSGPSGSGKSSLLRVLAGLDAAASGSIRLEGREPASWGWPRYRRRVNLLFQKPALPDGTLRANLARPFEYATADEPFPEDLARDLLGRLGLGGKGLDSDPRKFSLGEQQRVCLVRSLLVRPALILLDEPSSALDPESARRVEEALTTERRERGMAMILAAHDPEQPARLGAEILRLEAHRHRGRTA